MNRRGENFVEVESDYEGDEFDNFFNFEEDLAGMESARRQVERLEMEKIKNNEFLANTNIENEEVPEEPTYFVMGELKEPEQKSGNDNVFFVFNELDDAEPELIEEEQKKYDDVVGFEFEYCSFVKKNGDRCKRQAPKDNKYCGTHRKYITKYGE